MLIAFDFDEKNKQNVISRVKRLFSPELSG